MLRTCAGNLRLEQTDSLCSFCSVCSEETEEVGPEAKGSGRLVAGEAKAAQAAHHEEGVRGDAS